MSTSGDKARAAKIVETAAAAPPARRAPVAFAIEPAERDGRGVHLFEEEPDFTQIADTTAESGASPSASRMGWLAGLFWSALGILVSFYLLDAIWDLIARLAAKNPMLGQTALGLAAFAGLVLLFLGARELFSILRQRRIQQMRLAAEAARAGGREADFTQVRRLLLDFYTADPTTASARTRLALADNDVLDPLTRLDMAERELLAPKDEEARRLIASAAQRVSMVTALSPRALVDMIFVLAQSIVMIRKLSALYGGNAGGLGLWRLGLRILAHLALTGGVGMADSVIGQVLGAGLAARLSAKLGEGVLNGILTARVGIAALAYCRPLEFSACEPIILSEVVKNIVTRDKVEEKPAV